MRILVAADKFKGSMNAVQSCRAIARGARVVFGEAVIEEIPVADGGEGTAGAIRGALGGERVSTSAFDALWREVNAGYSLVEEKGGKFCAVMEMSAASGLWQLRAEELNPRRATTYGTGQMLVDAMARGVEKILIGIGGSATNDGGTGMAEALGYRFFDDKGHLLEKMPANLERLVSIKAPILWDPPGVEVACDVNAPLLGENGATRVFGPQKGISGAEVDFFEERLERLADVVARDLGSDRRMEAGAGAAGGLGFGLLSFCGARLFGGFELIAGLIGLEEALRGADLVLTGEGRIDGQTGQGKAPSGVGAMARKHGIPVVAFCGESEGGGKVAEIFDGVVSIRERHPQIDGPECMARGEELLEETVAGSGDLLRKALQIRPARR